MSTVIQELRITLRSFRLSPGFTVVAVLTLGIAVGATNAVFSVVNGVLLRPLPYERPEELVVFNLNTRLVAEAPFSIAGYFHFKTQATSFVSIGAYSFQPSSATILGSGEPEELTMARASAGFWATLGVGPLIGRIYSEEEDVPGATAQAVIGEGYWTRRYGRDPGVIGTTFELNGNSVQVLGVIPEKVRFPFEDIDLWVSTRLDPASQEFNSHTLRSVARLRPGATVETAHAEVLTLTQRLGDAGYDDWWFENFFTGTANVEPLRDRIVGNVRRPLMILLGVTGFVLLIGCVNVANLLLVRGEQRAGQTAIRRALGATRLQIARFVLLESAVLAVVGGVLGLGFAWWGVEGLLAMRPESVPRLDGVSVFTAPVFMFSFGVAAFTALVFGAFPAFRLGRVKATAAVRGQSAGSSGRGAQRLNALLVVSETALATVVVVGAGLLTRSAVEVRNTDPGYTTENILSFRISMPPGLYPEGSDVVNTYNEIISSVGALPGVQSVAAVTFAPLTAGLRHWMGIGRVEDYEPREGESLAYRVRFVTPGYFETLGIPLRQGRDFNTGDNLPSAPVLILSEKMPEQFWPGRDPLGRTVGGISVVGTVGEIRDMNLTEANTPVAYYPMGDTIWGFGLRRQVDVVARTDGDPLALVPAVREQVSGIEPNLPIFHVRTLGDIAAESMDQYTFAERMMMVAAAIALFLGAVGIYGVLAYSVRRRTPEFGIRMALGADLPTMLGLVFRQGLSMTALGVGIGLVGAVAMGRLIASLLFGVTAFDPLTYVMTGVAFLVVSFMACLVPALRAARVDPATALRDS